MAVGARPANVERSLIGEACRFAALGAAAADDPWVTAAAVLVLFAAALAAAAWPTRRAARIDPMQVLRG
jgi:ABC-type antimicrobial peptide transport system permease subunit